MDFRFTASFSESLTQGEAAELELSIGPTPDFGPFVDVQKARILENYENVGKTLFHCTLCYPDLISIFSFFFVR